jgi:hypothetical protein
MAGECGHSPRRLDGGERAHPGVASEWVAWPVPHPTPVDAGDGGEVREQLVGVSRTDPVIEPWHVVEHLTPPCSPGTERPDHRCRFDIALQSNGETIFFLI